MYVQQTFFLSQSFDLYCLKVISGLTLSCRGSGDGRAYSVVFGLIKDLLIYTTRSYNKPQPPPPPPPHFQTPTPRPLSCIGIRGGRGGKPRTRAVLKIERYAQRLTHRACLGETTSSSDRQTDRHVLFGVLYNK